LLDSTPRPASGIEPRPWQTGLAPAYIGLFLWVGFLDQVGRRALPVGGLACSVLGALVAGPACYLLMFRAAGLWGFRSGRLLAGVAASTFGERGALVLPGLLLAAAQVLVFGLAVGYAIDLTLDGLVVGRLLDPRAVRPTPFRGAQIPTRLVLLTALVWAMATALVSLRFVRWIGALMQFFPIFPAFLLGLVMLATLGGLRTFRPSGIDPLDGSVVPLLQSCWRAFALTFQWVFAFTAMSCVLGADWGPGSAGERDVRLGGWVGVGFAPAIVAALTLLAVAGFEGSSARPGPPSPRAGPRPGPREAARPAAPPSGSTIGDLPAPGTLDLGPTAGPSAPFTFRAVLKGAFDPRLACGMLMVFGLASLAPAVFSAYSAWSGLATLAPGISKVAWSVIVGTTGWLLIVAGWQDRPATAFDLLGAGFAPMAGALAADFALSRGRWRGPRRGINPTGVLAWASGAAVGLAPTVAQALGSKRLNHFEPAALAAFAVAFLAYALFALLRLQSGRAGAVASDPSEMQA